MRSDTPTPTPDAEGHPLRHGRLPSERGSDLVLDVLPRTRLRDQAATAIRAQVVSGALRPGQLYAIGSIAKQLGVSPTPVREAVLDLASANLVEVVRQRGFRVVTMTEQDLDEIVEIRFLLEVPTLGRLAARRPTPDLSALRPLADRLDAHAATGDMTAYLAADRELHLALLALAGNRRLVEIVGQLRDQTRLYGLASMGGTHELFNTTREHGELLDLIEAGEAKETAALMRRHLQHARGVWAGLREGSEAAHGAGT
jgi:DNA-binding GntR family transcriptional regulator